MARYRKSRMWAPQGFFECEGRGLQWLGEAQAQGGPRVVDVYEWGKDFLDIERVSPCSPTAKAAHDFGAALARMHDAGTDHFGSAPAGYDGTCYFGPLQDPVPMATRRFCPPDSSKGDFSSMSSRNPTNWAASRTRRSTSLSSSPMFLGPKAISL